MPELGRISMRGLTCIDFTTAVAYSKDDCQPVTHGLAVEIMENEREFAAFLMSSRSGMIDM